MSLLALMLCSGKDVYLYLSRVASTLMSVDMKRNPFSALLVCITDGKVRNRLISGAGTGGGGTGSSVLGKLIAP